MLSQLLICLVGAVVALPPGHDHCVDISRWKAVEVNTTRSQLCTHRLVKHCQLRSQEVSKHATSDKNNIIQVTDQQLTVALPGVRGCAEHGVQPGDLGGDGDQQLHLHPAVRHH